MSQYIGINDKTPATNRRVCSVKAIWCALLVSLYLIRLALQSGMATRINSANVLITDSAESPNMWVYFELRNIIPIGWWFSIALIRLSQILHAAIFELFDLMLKALILSIYIFVTTTRLLPKRKSNLSTSLKWDCTALRSPTDERFEYSIIIKY